MHRRRRSHGDGGGDRLIGFDRVYGGVPRFAGEAPWSRRVAHRLLADVACDTETNLFGRIPRVGDAEGIEPFVFVCADPEALVPPGSQRRLLAALETGSFDLVCPVSNESAAPSLRRAPACVYLTPSELVEVAEMMAGAGSRMFVPAEPDLPVYAIRRSALGRFPPETPLADLPRLSGRTPTLSVGADPSAFVHRYGAMDASSRADLAEKLPAGARRVLDVGCSQGATAEALRRAGAVEIYGIELDPADARVAATRCDRVIPGSLFDVAEPWDGFFDAILFGDVLEHLADPARALFHVRPWLSQIGRVIASVPNVGNAAVVRDLLQGRFDYVPYATLSGTHVRFFTRATIRDLFEACELEVVEIDAQAVPFAPETESVLRRLAGLPGASPDLAFAEFIVVARVPGATL